MSLAVSADGRTLVAGDINGHADVWQLDALSCCATYQHIGADISRDQRAVDVGANDYRSPG